MAQVSLSRSHAQKSPHGVPTQDYAVPSLPEALDDPRPRPSFREKCARARLDSVTRLLALGREELNRLHNILHQGGYELRVASAEGVQVFPSANGQAGELTSTGGAVSAAPSRVKTESEAVGGPSATNAAVADAEGDLIALLEARPSGGGGCTEMNPVIQAVLSIAARAVEERLFRYCYRREWVVAAVPQRAPHRGVLFAVDRACRIIGADEKGRALLSRSRTSADAHDLWSLFEREESLFRRRHTGDAASLLACDAEEGTWWVLVTPPQQDTYVWSESEAECAHFRPRLDTFGALQVAAPRQAQRGGLTPITRQRVLQFIAAHLEENIDVAMLARAAGLSKHHFSRAFKQSVGLPPRCYVMQQRLRRGQRLLVESDLPLAEVAAACGFSDQSHFSRVFSAAVKVSPGAWRRARR